MIIIAGFGLSTFPALMGLGLLVTRLLPHIKHAFYRVVAVRIVLLGLRKIFHSLSFNGWIPLERL